MLRPGARHELFQVLVTVLTRAEHAPPLQTEFATQPEFSTHCPEFDSHGLTKYICPYPVPPMMARVMIGTCSQFQAGGGAMSTWSDAKLSRHARHRSAQSNLCENDVELVRRYGVLERR